jgi:ABC-type glycerol-3-phosphate transport system substrate-binding protein
MKNSKRSLMAVLLVLVLAVAMLAAGCGGSDDSAAPAGDNGETDAPEESLPEIDGERHETETVSMIVADGWEVMDISGGLQAYKGMSSAVEVWVRGSDMTEESVKAAIERFKENYDGSDLFEVQAHGLTYTATTFEFSGMYQTKYGAVKDGMQVEITLAGEDHLNDETIMGMFNSIVFK